MKDTSFVDRTIRLHLDAITIDSENPKRQVTQDSPLYTLYTSGSTGKPKAASVSLGNEMNLLHWYSETYGLDASQRVLVFSAIGFDLTQKNLLGSLCFGAACHFSPAPFYDPEVICKTIEQEQITWVNCAPSAFYPLVDFADGTAQLASLKQVFLGGENIQVDRLSSWLAHSQTQLINMYGPTECADITTSIHISPGNNKLPIGKAIDNVKTYVLDANQQLLPEGVIGELCIAGRSVGLGYFKNQSLNDKIFIANPYSQDADDKILYRTGDLVRYNSQGLLEFVARNDAQMKIRGMRVDPEEIEGALKAIEGVADAVVNLQGTEQNHLVAFIRSTSELQESSFYQQQLAQRLARFMIPVAFERIDQIPLSPNGKVDRKQLPEIALYRSEDIPFVAPRNPIEQELALIWQSLLGIDRVSVHDDFFHLGGHSLLATQLMIRIREAFAMDLPLRTVFEVSTLEGLAEIIFSLTQHDMDIALEEGVL
ncbi:MAG: non-ribosomal peptide synthetase [Cellvibrionales bacterium]|nr:non-ribosomal peptide synthetase [Cellvibrionales bacterium]